MHPVRNISVRMNRECDPDVCGCGANGVLRSRRQAGDDGEEVPKKDQTDPGEDSQKIRPVLKEYVIDSTQLGISQGKSKQRTTRGVTTLLTRVKI